MAKPRYAYRLGWRSLKAVCPSLSASEARALADALGPAMAKFHINTSKRAAHFIAQLAHESGEFRWREELASGAAYEGRRDLGNTHPGDGRRYKGRSFIQITGRANYQAVSRALGVDFVARPTKLAERKYAALAAAWWWYTHGCNALADRDSVLDVTRRINGGYNGLTDRKKYLRRAKLVARFLIPKRRRPS